MIALLVSVVFFIGFSFMQLIAIKYFGISKDIIAAIPFISLVVSVGYYKIICNELI